MASFKISSFMIAIVLVSLVITGLTMFMSESQDKYGMSSGEEEIDKLLSNMTGISNEMYSISKNIKENSTKITDNEGVIDKIGWYFRSGYAVLTTASTSYETFYKTTELASDKIASGLGSETNSFFEVLRISLIVIVLIAIFIGVILSAVVKRDL